MPSPAGGKTTWPWREDPLGWLGEGEAQVFQGGISPGADDAHLLAAQLLSQVVGCGKGGCPRRLCKGVGSFDQPQLCPQDLFVGKYDEVVQQLPEDALGEG